MVCLKNVWEINMKLQKETAQPDLAIYRNICQVPTCTYCTPHTLSALWSALHHSRWLLLTCIVPEWGWILSGQGGIFLHGCRAAHIDHRCIFLPSRAVAGQICNTARESKAMWRGKQLQPCAHHKVNFPTLFHNTATLHLITVTLKILDCLRNCLVTCADPHTCSLQCIQANFWYHDVHVVCHKHTFWQVWHRSVWVSGLNKFTQCFDPSFRLACPQNHLQSTNLWAPACGMDSLC